MGLFELVFLAVVGFYVWPLALGAAHIFGFRFSVRALLILMTVIAILLGMIAWIARS